MLYHTCLWLDCACGCSACCTCPLQPFVSPRPLPPTLLPPWLPHVVKHAAWAFGARPAGARAAEHTSALTAPLPTALGLPTHGEQWVWQWRPLWLWQMNPERRTEAVEHVEAQQKPVASSLGVFNATSASTWTRWACRRPACELLPMGAAAMRRGTAQFAAAHQLLDLRAPPLGWGSCAQRPQLVGVPVCLMRCPGLHWSPPSAQAAGEPHC